MFGCCLCRDPPEDESVPPPTTQLSIEDLALLAEEAKQAETRRKEAIATTHLQIPLLRQVWERAMEALRQELRSQIQTNPHSQCYCVKVPIADKHVRAFRVFARRLPSPIADVNIYIENGRAPHIYCRVEMIQVQRTAPRCDQTPSPGPNPPLPPPYSS